MTMVDRQSACIVGYRVAFQRTEALMQEMLDEAPQADLYYSDGLVTYGALFYELPASTAARSQVIRIRLESTPAIQAEVPGL